MNWKDKLHGKEAELWKWKYKNCIKLCKCIWENYRIISDLKYYINEGNMDLAASEVWNELDPEVQKLLITAPRYGGPFTTEERAKIRDLWEVSIDDLDTP